MRKSIIIVIVSFVIAVLLINQFVDAPIFNDPKEKLEFVIKEKQNDRLDLIYMELLVEDSLSIDNHYGFIANYFQYPLANRIISEKDLTNIYWNYADCLDSKLSDIGFYGLGLISSMKNEYNKALIFYTQVSNDKLKYLNNSFGRVCAEISDFDEAEKYYYKAIKFNGNVEGAYSNLIDLYYSQQRYDDLYKLLKDRGARKYFPSHLKRYLFLSKYNPIGYFQAVFSHTYQNQNLVGFLGALLV
ncbi:MAG: hypothetical protein KAQ75_01940, partial [Bacteroidales bacterium]|nr:hypothetical protein [Bacteroidales bacterium]